MDLALKWAYLKQLVLKNLPVTIALLLLFVAWSNYAYHGWKGLIGPLLLTIALVALSVRLIEQGEEQNKAIQKRLYEETVRNNRLDMQLRTLQEQVASLSRPPTSLDVISTVLVEAEGLISKDLGAMQDTAQRWR